ncbi:hypothetical protein AAT19DRAFT_16228 [Rhodotorula toruloides]|uniref:DAGKc domain-containing protein n=1 Tax=Rhodotorula toruloides TaxID=5286 RepID=A0A2T0A641_RHOTO|nr:hypothetical protein AAT19DRAFT_16228 [Rhodotorula toruloides]
MASEQIPTEPVDAPSFLAQHAPHIDLTQTTKTPRPPSHLTVILNPSAGSRHALQLWANLVQPILIYFLSLSHNNSWLDWSGEVEETRDVRDGERIGREIARQARKGRKEVLVVFGGDGTVHEVLNGVLMRQDGEVSEGVEVELVLIPTGTANALYYHLFPPESPSYPSTTPIALLYCLLAFLSPTSTSALPLSLALNTLPSGEKVLTTVVSSTALHACLLHTAERLRHTRPELEGTERFKVAAQMEVGRWWDGHLTLRLAKLYDPSTKSWVKQEEKVEGPFSYLVSALTSRFEQSFLVAPFRSPFSPLAPEAGEASIDVVAIRPLRRRQTRELVEAGEGERAREEFARTLWDVTGRIYEGGKHVDVLYDDAEGGEGGQGEGREEKGRGVVEVWRCEGLEWVPPQPQRTPPKTFKTLPQTRTRHSSPASSASTAPYTTSVRTVLCIWKRSREKE